MPTVSLTNYSNTEYQLIIDGNTYLLKKVNSKTAVSGNYILLFYQEVETNALRQQWKLLYSDFTDPTAANAIDLKAKIDFIIDSYANYTDLVLVEVKNTSGSPISKGTPVYITGTVGATNVLTIAPADAANSAKMPATGLLYSTLANNEFGHVIVTGLLTQITTNPIDGLTPTVNQTVYVKPGGGLTLTKPTGTNLIQNVGKVGRVNGGGAGSIAVANIQRSNDIPNLAQNNIWIGNASGVPTATTLSGDVTNSAGVVTIANDAVTFGKMQNISAASRLLGRGDSGAGDVQEITLGSGLSMSGTTLSSSGGGVTTIGTIDSQTKAANGAVISGSSLVMQTADGISPGLVSTVSQTFAGLKTFSGNIISGTVTGSTSASGTLTLSSTSNATKGKLLFGTSAYDEVNNRLGIGIDTPAIKLHCVATASAVGVPDAPENAFMDRYVATNGPSAATMVLRKARGTFASPSAVLSGDALGVFGFRGYNGTAMTTGSRAFLLAYASENWSTTANGTYFVFGTTTNGTTTGTERLRIDNDGNVLIGTITNAGYNLDINGTTRTQGDFTISDAKNIILATTTGTKIGTATSQKLSFWNATPIVQPTTAVAAATRVGGGGTTVTDTDTFDGYTIAQIVKALRNTGILA